jgi:hypothetical protein
MKRFINFCAVLLAVSLIAEIGPRAQPRLKLKFGLESTDLHVEEKAGPSGNASVKTPRKKGAASYRFFTVNPSWHKTFLAATERHAKLWTLLEKESKARPFRIEQAEFAKLVKDRDPYLAGMVTGLAPRLYFEFTDGVPGTEYVLESIDINTLEFDEYRGGGFFDKEAWYDILLRHKPGMYSHDVGKRLRFKDSGRAVLRFWSDNWYPQVGMAPQGCYLIDITFVFTIGGTIEKVSTGPFKIDV